MKPAVLLLALALATPLLDGQQLETTAPRPDAIEGTVVNGVTGEPLKKASVTVRRSLSRAEARLMRLRAMGMDMSQSAVTDTTGRFVFSNLQPGDYNLWANRPGFVGEGYRGRRRGAYENLHLTSGETVDDVQFKLMPGAVISGKVVDEDGDPVIGAMVQALRYNWINGERQLSAFGGGNTNDLGEYRIFDLIPGTYYVRTFWQAQAEGTDQVYAPVYYPQARDPSAAVAIPLKAAGEADDTDLTLLSIHAVRIRGQVISPDGSERQGGFNLMLMPRGDFGSPELFHPTQIGANGSFEICAVTLSGQDALDSSVTVSHDNPPGALVLALDPHGGEVQGTVTNDQKPYGGATVVLVPDPAHRSQDRFYHVAYTDDSGHFAMRGISPGEYKVFACDQVDEAAYMDAAFLSLYESRGAEVHLDADGQANVQTELIVTTGSSE